MGLAGELSVFANSGAPLLTVTLKAVAALCFTSSEISTLTDTGPPNRSAAGQDGYRVFVNILSCGSLAFGRAAADTDIAVRDQFIG
jgi:hypothetical protein